jgi:hypothetical protein
LSIGQKVRISGLKAGADYNGKEGVAVEHVGGRWTVEVALETGAKKLKIKPENLQMIA